MTTSFNGGSIQIDVFTDLIGKGFFFLSHETLKTA